MHWKSFLDYIFSQINDVLILSTFKCYYVSEQLTEITFDYD